MKSFQSQQEIKRIWKTGNKEQLDINWIRAISTEEGEQVARENEAMFFECSAKVGTGVNDLFMSLAQLLPGSEMSQIISNPKGIVFWYSLINLKR